jgi:hypothetical protein
MGTQLSVNTEQSKNPVKPKVIQDIHTQAKFMFEVEGLSRSEIGTIVKRSTATIERWCKKFNWSAKGSGGKEVAELSRKKMLHMAAEKGMPLSSYLEEVIKGITDPVIETVIGQDEDGKPVIHTRPDWPNKHKYMTLFGKLMGATDGAAKGLEVNTNGSGNTQVQIFLPELDT